MRRSSLQMLWSPAVAHDWGDQIAWEAPGAEFDFGEPFSVRVRAPAPNCIAIHKLGILEPLLHPDASPAFVWRAC